MQRHAAAARSEAAECRELQQLRSVYFHWPSVLAIHSSQSELLLGLSGRDLSIRPAACPSSSLYISPSIQRCAASAAASGKVRHIIFDQRSWQLFFFFLNSSDPDNRFITGGVIAAFSGRWWVSPPVFSCEEDSTATLRCGNDLTCGQATRFNILLTEWDV